MMKDARTQAEARRASTWIERFALPLTVSVMEAQPLALGIALLVTLVAGTSASPPFGAGSIALVALGLQWWAMFVEGVARRRLKNKPVIALHALGWFVAFTLSAVPYLLAVVGGKTENIFTILLAIALVTWFWRRGMSRAQAGYEYGALARSFKGGFGIVLGILFLAVVFSELQTLREDLILALPLFFLSGLIMLSLARLGVIRASHRLLENSQPADPTRSWLLVLTLFGVSLLGIVFVIESVFSFASFELVLAVLTPLWNALGTLVGWILYGVVFLLSPIFYLISWLVSLLKQHASSPSQQQNSKPPKSPIQQVLNSHTFPPELLTIGRWVFLALVLLVTILVVRASLRRWLVRKSDEGIAEEREALDARSLLSQHWRDWWKRRRKRDNSTIALEPLDPSSARARYREMLQALATSDSGLARTSAETPVEYETRLLVRLGGEQANAASSANSDDGVTERAVLEELTGAYTRERYGGKQTDDGQRARLRISVPRLIARLGGRTTTKTPTTHRAPL
jgi:hypothetical protein